MAAPGVSDQLYQAALDRMNYNFELDASTERSIRNALLAAQSYLRKESANPELRFDDPDISELLMTCAWYIINHKKADFGREYSDELTSLRLMEGFGCGKESTSV